MSSLFMLLGYVGIIFLLLGYFLLIVGQLKVTDTHYIMMNLMGAVFVILSLYTGGTMPVFYVIMGWLFISVFGYYKHHIVTH